MKMNNRVYDVLKFIAQIILPAVATFYATMAEIWGFPMGNEVGRTIMAVDTLLGAILMISTANYNKFNNKIEDTQEENA